MEIIDLAEKYEQTYFNCLEDWSDDIKEAKPHKENWYNIEKQCGGSRMVFLLMGKR